MPRAARAKKPLPRLTTSKKPTAKTPPEVRSSEGRFIAGNPGGPGNPNARHCARMLALLRTSVSDEELVAIIRALLDKAVKGDTSAAKIILSYKIGKPAPAPNSDQIDQDEWEHYQKDTINLQEMQQVLSSLPAKVGNDIARTALPIMTEARTRELATQLRKGSPIPEEVIEPTVDAASKANQAPPLPNGKLKDATSTNRSTVDNQRPTNLQYSARKSSRLKGAGTTHDQPQSTIDSRSTLPAPRSTPTPDPSNDNRPSTQRFTLHPPRSTSHAERADIKR